MSTQSIKPPFPLFCDRDGSPLDAGYIYIGAANLPPQTNPIVAYWDADLTIPAAQPIRTSGGYPVRNGTPTRLYVSGGYSLLVTDSKGTLVYSAAEADGSSVTATVQSFSGNGATVSFTLAQAPGAAETLIVRISGVVQTPGVDFTVSGTTLTFTDAPPLGAGNIVVQAIGEVGVSGAGTLVNAQYVVYSDTTPLTTILTPLGLGGAIQVNKTTGAVSIGSNLGVVGALTVTGTTTLTGAATLTANPTLSAGTANGVLYLDGSKVATSGSGLIFDGTNLGIGTAGPGARLDVVGSLGIRINEDGSGTKVLSLRSNFAGLGPAINVTTNDPLLFLTNSTERMRLDASGNLGIGTATITQRLEISGDIQQQNANYLRGRLAAGTSTRLFGLNGANSLYIGGIDASQSETLFVRGGVTQMALDASGNLGIGTASPGVRLDVNGTTRIRGGAALILQNAAADANASISASGGSGSNAMSFNSGAMLLDASGNWILGTAALATTATAGFPWIPSCAGIPTGAPTAPYTNAAAMVVDSTNNRLYVRVGSTWRYATLT